MGLQAPTSGSVSILGYDMAVEEQRLEALERTGYLPAYPSFDEQSTGREVLDLHESLKGGTRRSELLELFEPPLDRKIREYATGNVQKLGIVQAFMHEPSVVVMDEPTSGLDPLLQERFNEFIHDERERGTTILFSSHVLSEVRRVCDRVAVLREGELVTVEDIHDLLDRSGKLVRVRVSGEVEESAFADVSGVSGLTRRESEGATNVSFTFMGDVDTLIDALDQHSLQELDVEEAPLEDVFLQFYGDEADSETARETIAEENADATAANGGENHV